MVKKFKGSAPKLYEKLEKKIRKKYLKGGIRPNDKSVLSDGSGHKYYNGGREDYRDYDYGGGREDYRDYDYNGSHRDRYYPDSMHGGALGLFRSEINRII